MAGFAAKCCHLEVGSGLRAVLTRCGASGVATTTRVPHNSVLVCSHGRLYHPGASWFLARTAATMPPPSDYLQTTSPVPTMHLQAAIPQLPIPLLADTCRRYLTSQEPLLSPEQLAITRALVEDFEQGVGRELNEELIRLNKINTHTSYVTDAWMDAYLAYRESMILGTSVALFINDDHRPAFMDQTLRAANVVVSVLRFAKTLREGRLVPHAIFRGSKGEPSEEFWSSLRSLSPQDAYRQALRQNVLPLDMTQFTRLFNATRIPRPCRDELFLDESQRHLLVLANGHMFVFDVLDSEGNILPGATIRSHLQYIVEQAGSLASPTHPVGYLGADHRDTWTRLREMLSGECPENEANLRLIDSSLLCVCLEADSVREPEDHLRRALYDNPANRWFDKPFQLIFTKDGRQLHHMEHSWGDGITKRRLFLEMHQDVLQRPALCPGDEAAAGTDSSASVKKLEFKLSPAICQGVEEAKDKLAQAASQLNVEQSEYSEYGYSFLKQSRVSPDAVAQLAMQMAYYSVTGRVPATYESCSTARFKHGRTETIRPATAETKRCSEALLGVKAGVGAAEKATLIRACSDKHRQLSREAAIGQGWDRHLFALRALAAGSSGRPLPDIFGDPAYAGINTIGLSTSTVGESPVVGGSVFAPVSPAGFGVAYTVRPDRVQWVATGYRASPSLAALGKGLHRAFDIIHQVLRS